MADPFDLLEAIEDYVARAVAPLQARIAELDAQIAARPAPERGADGVNGKDAEVDYERVGGVLKALVSTVPAGRDGEDGAPGERGQDGAPGAPGERGKDGAPGADADVDELVQRMTRAIERKAATYANA